MHRYKQTDWQTSRSRTSRTSHTIQPSKEIPILLGQRRTGFDAHLWWICLWGSRAEPSSTEHPQHMSTPKEFKTNTRVYYSKSNFRAWTWVPNCPRLKRFHEYTNFPESSNFLGNSKCKISCTVHLRAEPPSTGSPQHVQNSGRVYVCTYQAFRNRYEYTICLGSSNTQSNRGRTNQTKRKNKSYNSLYENEHE